MLMKCKGGSRGPGRKGIQISGNPQTHCLSALGWITHWGREPGICGFVSTKKPLADDLNDIISQRWVTLPGVKPDTGTQEEFCPLVQATTTTRERAPACCSVLFVCDGFFQGIQFWFQTVQLVGGGVLGRRSVVQTQGLRGRRESAESNNFRQINMSERSGGTGDCDNQRKETWDRQCW